MVPVVLHHGLMGHGDFQAGPLKVSYFGGIARAIAERGHPVIASWVHPTASVVTRARQLKESILRRRDLLGRPRRRVVILAHSMGGLDARYMIAHLGMADHVEALVTVCTPHRGSPFADWWVTHFGRRLGGFQLMQFLRIDISAANDLTTRSCRAFNEAVPDAPGVRYYSISCARPWHQMPPWALHSYRVVAAAEGPNDGLVSVTSSTWGEHLGVWPADHWHSLNRRFLRTLANPAEDIRPYWLDALARATGGGGDPLLRAAGGARTGAGPAARQPALPVGDSAELVGASRVRASAGQAGA
jgi:triacylglycerol lipase